MSYLPLGCSKAVSVIRIPEYVVYLEGDPKIHRQGIEAEKERKPVRGAWSSPWPQQATEGPTQWGILGSTHEERKLGYLHASLGGICLKAAPSWGFLQVPSTQTDAGVGRKLWPPGKALRQYADDGSQKLGQHWYGQGPGVRMSLPATDSKQYHKRSLGANGGGLKEAPEHDKGSEDLGHHQCSGLQMRN